MVSEVTLADILDVANAIGGSLGWLIILGGVLWYAGRKLNAWFHELREWMRQITEQTTITNGRVNGHDEDVKEIRASQEAELKELRGEMKTLHDQVLTLTTTMATVLELTKGTRP